MSENANQSTIPRLADTEVTQVTTNQSTIPRLPDTTVSWAPADDAHPPRTREEELALTEAFGRMLQMKFGNMLDQII